VSPRKSSTSSGKDRSHRPRYLGVEVAGEHLPPSSPRHWEAILASRLRADPAPTPAFRIVRTDGRRAIVELDHRAVGRARAAWNGPARDASEAVIATRRTWGTLVGAKAWLRGGTSALDRSDTTVRAGA